MIGTFTLYDGLSLSWITLLVSFGGMAVAMIAGMPAMVRTRFATPTIGRAWMIGEMGEAIVPGQADSAPHRFDLKRHLARAAFLALVLFGIYYANWHYAWITTDQLDFYN